MFKKIKKFLKKRLSEKIIFRLRIIAYMRFTVLYYIFRIFPINNRKIIISNYHGQGYGDNGKYIAEEILKNNMDLDIVWLVKPNYMGDFPKKIRTVRYGSIKSIYEEVTAKVWIDNCRKPYFVRKRKEQYYIQTWHGCIPLKKIEKDVENKLNKYYVISAKQDSKIADLFISNSKFCTELYKSSFWYKGKVLECGSPRCDILYNFNNEIIEKVRSYFNINKDKKILIYAPTFRADESLDAYSIDFEKLKEALKNKFGGDWVIFIRLHPNISFKSSLIKYNSEIINVTEYNDMYELLLVSNILITDYSSTMFEFSLTHKPVFLYATDIASYVQDRSFYFDIRSLPYPLAENNKQLIKIVENFDMADYISNLERFLSNLGVVENGNASLKVYNEIKRVIR